MTKQKFLISALFALPVSIVVGMLQLSIPAHAGPAGPPLPAPPACDERRLLTAPPWYRGLTSGPDCDISVDNAPGSTQSDKLRSFIQILALNVVEIMMHIVSYVCVAFIIMGGFKYMTSTGSPDGNVKGRQTIQNALIGLVISIASIGIVNFLAGGMW